MVIEKLIRLEIFMEIIIGNNKVNSTSKMRKITAIKKNWRENGARADLFGSNPHSKGDLFSRSENVFFEIRFIKIIKIIIITQMIKVRVVRSLIIYTRVIDFLIGSQI